MSLYLKELTVKTDPRLMAAFEEERRSCVTSCSLFDNFPNTALLSTGKKGFMQLVNLSHGSYHTFLTHLNGVDVPMEAPLRFATLSPALYLAHRECHHIFYALAHGPELLCANVNTGAVSTIASFSSRPSAIYADGEYVVCGTSNGEIHCWRATTLLYDGALLRTRPQGVANMSIERSLLSSMVANNNYNSDTIMMGSTDDDNGVGIGGGDIYPATFVNDSGSVLFRIKHSGMAESVTTKSKSGKSSTHSFSSSAITSLRVFRDWLIAAADDFSVAVYSMGFSASMDTSFPSASPSSPSFVAGAASQAGTLLCHLPHPSSVVRGIICTSPLHLRIGLLSDRGYISFFQHTDYYSIAEDPPRRVETLTAAAAEQRKKLLRWRLLGSHFVQGSSTSTSTSSPSTSQTLPQKQQPTTAKTISYRNGFVIVGTQDGRVIIYNSKEDSDAAYALIDRRGQGGDTTGSDNNKKQLLNQNPFFADSNPILEELVTFDVQHAVVGAQILANDVLVVITSVGAIWRWPMSEVMQSVKSQRGGEKRAEEKRPENSEEEGQEQERRPDRVGGRGGLAPEQQRAETAVVEAEGVRFEGAAAYHQGKGVGGGQLKSYHENQKYEEENNEYRLFENRSSSSSSSSSTPPSPSRYVPARPHELLDGQSQHQNQQRNIRHNHHSNNSNNKNVFEFDEDALFVGVSNASGGPTSKRREEEENQKKLSDVDSINANLDSNSRRIAAAAINTKKGNHNNDDVGSEEKRFPSKVSIIQDRREHEDHPYEKNNDGDGDDHSNGYGKRKGGGHEKRNDFSSLTKKSSSSSSSTTAAVAVVLSGGAALVGDVVTSSLEYNPDLYRGDANDDDDQGEKNGSDADHNEETNYSKRMTAAENSSSRKNRQNPADVAIALYSSNLDHRQNNNGNDNKIAITGLKEGKRMDPRRVKYGLEIATTTAASHDHDKSTGKDISDRHDHKGESGDDEDTESVISRLDEKIDSYMRANPTHVNALKMKHGLASANSYYSRSSSSRGGAALSTTFNLKEKVYSAVPELTAPVSTTLAAVASKEGNNRPHSDDLVDATFTKFARKKDEQFERERHMQGPSIARHGCEDLLFVGGGGGARFPSTLAKKIQQRTNTVCNTASSSDKAATYRLSDKTSVENNKNNYRANTTLSNNNNTKNSPKGAGRGNKNYRALEEGNATADDDYQNDDYMYFSEEFQIPPPATTIFFAEPAISTRQGYDGGLGESNNTAGASTSLFGRGPFEDYFIPSLPMAP